MEALLDAHDAARERSLALIRRYGAAGEGGDAAQRSQAQVQEPHGARREGQELPRREGERGGASAEPVRAEEQTSPQFSFAGASDGFSVLDLGYVLAARLELEPPSGGAAAAAAAALRDFVLDRPQRSASRVAREEERERRGLGGPAPPVAVPVNAAAATTRRVRRAKRRVSAGFVQPRSHESPPNSPPSMLSPGNHVKVAWQGLPRELRAMYFNEAQEAQAQEAQRGQQAQQAELAQLAQAPRPAATLNAGGNNSDDTSPRESPTNEPVAAARATGPAAPARAGNYCAPPPAQARSQPAAPVTAADKKQQAIAFLKKYDALPGQRAAQEAARCPPRRQAQKQESVGQARPEEEEEERTKQQEQQEEQQQQQQQEQHRQQRRREQQLQHQEQEQQQELERQAHSAKSRRYSELCKQAREMVLAERAAQVATLRKRHASAQVIQRFLRHLVVERGTQHNFTARATVHKDELAAELGRQTPYATLLQAVFRGHMARVSVKRMAAAQTAAIIVLQRLFRRRASKSRKLRQAARARERELQEARREAQEHREWAERARRLVEVEQLQLPLTQRDAAAAPPPLGHAKGAAQQWIDEAPEPALAEAFRNPSLRDASLRDSALGLSAARPAECSPRDRARACTMLVPRLRLQRTSGPGDAAAASRSARRVVAGADAPHDDADDASRELPVSMMAAPVIELQRPQNPITAARRAERVLSSGEAVAMNAHVAMVVAREAGALHRRVDNIKHLIGVVKRDSVLPTLRFSAAARSEPAAEQPPATAPPAVASAIAATAAAAVPTATTTTAKPLALPTLSEGAARELALARARAAKPKPGRVF
jgi:hypothetical protein